MNAPGDLADADVARAGGHGMAPGRRLVAAAVAVNLFVAALVAAGLVQSHRHERAEASRQAENVARLLAGRLRAAFDSVDLALHAAADEVARGLATGGVDGDELEQVLARQRLRAQSALGIRILDARGVARWGAPPVPAPIDLSHRQYFRTLREDPAAPLQISGPVRGPVLDRLVLVLARRISRTDGSFGGVATGAVEVGELSGMLSRVDVGSGGTIALRLADQTLVASHHPLPMAIGTRYASPEVQALLAAGDDSGAYETTSGVDGVRRFYAFARVGGYPLYVVSGLARQDVLRHWRLQTVGLLALFACFATGTIAAALAERRALRRRAAFERLARAQRERLRESEERLRIAFETSPDAIALTDVEDGTFLTMNQGFTRLVGWPEAEVVGRRSSELGIWDDPADRERLTGELRAGGAVSNLEVRFRTRTGGTLDVLLSARLLTLRGRALILSVGRDISDWKRAEAERDRLRQQVQQAQKLDSIGQLAGGIAHDFNNLLTVILSCADTLRDDLGAGRPTDPEAVTEIAAAGIRARDLTRQLLAFARKQRSAPESLDLNAVVAGTERLLRRTLREDVAVVVRAEAGLWPVWCDPVQMEQVLLNLCVNARDAMPDGGLLTLETRNLPAAPDGEGAGEDRVLLAVQDTGVGMSAEVQAHLFEPFFTTKPLGKGTGLGLATVHGIVTQGGGRIRVETQPGRGTRFEITFPRTRRAARDEVPAGEGARRGTETVLVVEDDPQVRSVTVRALEAAGYRVLVAGHAAEALALARVAPEKLDLLVTDVVMPGPSGTVLATELRRARPDLRVLLVSGYAREALVTGADGAHFLQKPFTPAGLQARVREILDRSP